MIRKGLLALGILVMAVSGYAQQHMPNRVNTYSDEQPATGFNKENLFVGGTLGVGFAGDEFNVGVNPEIGFSLNRWLDVGAVLNFSYTSIKADPELYYNNNTRSREFIYGGGVFARAYVLPFLFLTAQPEFNWTSVTQTYEGSGGGSASYNANAPSLLLGVGYGQRIVGQSTFFIALMFDAISNVNSPYNDVYGHPEPVIRGGFDIYLGRKR